MPKISGYPQKSKTHQPLHFHILELDEDVHSGGRILATRQKSGQMVWGLKNRYYLRTSRMDNHKSKCRAVVDSRALSSLTNQSVSKDELSIM